MCVLNAVGIGYWERSTTRKGRATLTARRLAALFLSLSVTVTGVLQTALMGELTAHRVSNHVTGEGLGVGQGGIASHECLLAPIHKRG